MDPESPDAKRWPPHAPPLEVPARSHDGLAPIQATVPDPSPRSAPPAGALPFRAPPVGAVERAAWLLAIVAIWMVTNLYAGLGHDGILYTMQALEHLRPDLWAQDIYVRYGSQDNYTLFTPLYAALIRLTGVEHAAQLLTFTAQLAFFGNAWLLARRLLGERCAFTGLFLLIALPGSYGAGDIFRVVEGFVTPRLLSEALVLCAILCWTHRRMKIMAVVTIAAMAIHPLMGVTAVALFLWLELAMPRPGLTSALAALALLSLVAVGLIEGGPPLQFDLAWYQWVPNNMTFMQMKQWHAADWGVTLATLTMLCAAIGTLHGQARNLAKAALGVGMAGIALTAIGVDWLHFILITQGQPWRCLWLSTVFATLFTPVVLLRLWHLSLLGRSAALLLVAQYLLKSEHFSLQVSALALGMLFVAFVYGASARAQYQRLAFYGALLIFALALLVAFASYYVVARYHYFPNQVFTGPTWLKNVREAGRNGLVGLLLVALLAALAAGRWRKIGVPLLLVASLAACAAMAPLSWGLWTRITFQESDKASFAAWRNLIPAGSEVLFTENPLFTWIFLERPSYISRAQLASALFSRPAAVVLTERETALRPYLRSQGQTFWDPDPTATPDVPTLAQACAVPDLQFVVSRVPLQATPIAEVPAHVSSDFDHLRLYRCPTSAGAT